jgi:RimJ/RimL family protein N-acetyltransferase
LPGGDLSPDKLRPLLQRDPAWSAFALGDLDPDRQPLCTWRVAGESVLLLYSGFDPPVLFAYGSHHELDPLVQKLEVPELSLQLQPMMLDRLTLRYQVTHLRPMLRMVLKSTPKRDDDTVDLRPRDLRDLELLHEDGRATGDAPQFFDPEMLRDGVFRGVRVNGDVVAVAGTFIVSPQEGVAAIGHVYTRRDVRGKGYATKATGAVAADLVELGCATVVLNVEQRNAAAIRVYEKLGFQRHCGFFEGSARLKTLG